MFESRTHMLKEEEREGKGRNREHIKSKDDLLGAFSLHLGTILDIFQKCYFGILILKRYDASTSDFKVEQETFPSQFNIS